MENEKDLQVELEKPVIETVENGIKLTEEVEILNAQEEEAEPIAELVQIDYPALTKQELLEHAKELLGRSDFKNVDAILREIKSAFDAIKDKDRSEALLRFKQQDGIEEDFEFKHDELDLAFDALTKAIRDKRNLFFKNQEELKADSLKKKLDILEKLRALTELEDSENSFRQFKELQAAWKNSGQVAPAHVKTLWANYTALVDRFYDNRNIYFELKELDRKKNLELKNELCAKAERLLAVEHISDAIKELNELHNEFKHIGAVPREEKETVWARFKAASDALYEKRDQYTKKLTEELQLNLNAKLILIEELESLAAFQSDRIKDWNGKTQQIIEIQKKWEEIGQVPRAKMKDVNKKFWFAFKAFFNNKNAFFKKLDGEREANLKLKFELVKRAEALKEFSDWEKTANELKELQRQWKEIGPVPEKFRETVFQEFKKACDFFFDLRREQFNKQDREQEENLIRKKEICQTLETLLESKSGTIDQLKSLQQEFNSIGFVPKSSVITIKNRFNDAVNKFLGTVGNIENREKLMLEVQISNLKGDPQGERKLMQKEQAIRKQIQTVENDIAVLRNNLEFFGRSKNADKYKEEFSKKIDEANDHLIQLKSQLKLLNTVQ
jgi:hypothetical protein